MAADKKKSSCLGLFFKGFLVSSLLLSNLVVACAIVDVKFLHGSYQAWTDFSSAETRPLLALYVVLIFSLGLGFLLSLASVVVSSFFSGSGSSKNSSRPPRPQSNRSTTV